MDFIPSNAKTARCLSFWLLVSLGACLVVCMPAAAQEERLLDQPAFDQVVLNQANGGNVLKVVPINFPNGKPTKPFPPGRLELRLLSQPSQPYEVLWRDVERIELFGDVLLNEAQRLTKSGKFEEAFDYFEHLYQRYPRLYGLGEAADAYLQANALEVFRQGENDLALAILGTLYERSPQLSQLRGAVDRVLDVVVKDYVRDGELKAARLLLDNTEKRFERLKLNTVAQWRVRFRKSAEKKLQEGLTALERGDYRTARKAASQAAMVWPTSDKINELLDKIQASYPAIVVGVRVESPQNLEPRLDSPATERIRPLLAPTLMEMRGYTNEGGRYRFSLGKARLDDAFQKVSLDFDSQQFGPHQPLEFSRWIIEGARREKTAALPGLFGILSSVGFDAGVTAQGFDTLSLNLARPHVRPEALLSSAPSPVPAEFEVGSRDETLISFSSTKEKSEGSDASSVATIDELYFNSDDAALAALSRGEIDVLDRVAPWQVKALEKSEAVEVGTYRLPTTHALLLGKRSTFTDQEEFRRALAYGINRKRILNELILAGESKSGFVVVSGPFPSGRSLADPVRYGYNDRVAPRPYEPRLAAILAAVAWTKAQKIDGAEAEELEKETSADTPTQGDSTAETASSEAESSGDEPPSEEEADRVKPPSKPMPPLTIAHSTDPVARAACISIAGQLRALGLEIELVELSADELLAEEPSFDLRYTELSVWEPVVDAARLLGPDGFAGRCSDQMLEGLRKLETATNWSEVNDQLQQLHERAYSELPLIPLWQTVNYYAYRRNMKGVPESTIRLYDTVQNWSVKNSR